MKCLFVLGVGFYNVNTGSGVCIYWEWFVYTRSSFVYAGSRLNIPESTRSGLYKLVVVCMYWSRFV